MWRSKESDWRNCCLLCAIDILTCQCNARGDDDLVIKRLIYAFYDHNDGLAGSKYNYYCKNLETLFWEEKRVDKSSRRRSMPSQTCPPMMFVAGGKQTEELTFPSAAAQSLIKKAWIEADARREHFSHVKTWWERYLHAQLFSYSSTLVKRKDLRHINLDLRSFLILWRTISNRIVKMVLFQMVLNCALTYADPRSVDINYDKGFFNFTGWVIRAARQYSFKIS